MGKFMGMNLNTDFLEITPEVLSLIAELDEFKGAWKALGTLAPDRLRALRRVATIESVGSSTRIDGVKLSDKEVAQLISNIGIKKFETRDEQEVAGYAEVMETVFARFDAVGLTENHISQLHRDLLIHSDKDERHRGNYKTNTNHVVAFDADGNEIGIVFETATPFDTPGLMSELAKDQDKVTIGQLVKLTQANRNTIKKHLRSLVTANHLIQSGTGKGTWYRRT